MKYLQNGFVRWCGGVVGAIALSVAGIWLLSWLFRPQLDTVPPFSYSEAEIQAVKELRDITPDLSNQVVIAQTVDYAEGESAAWYPKGESPLLAKLVAEGALPPVAERIGPEPLVLKGVEGLGTYGGTWRMVEAAGTGSGILFPRMYLSYPSLVRYSPNGYPVVGHLATHWDVSDDSREFTFHLRKGIRWSDGHPFTADDLLYWWEAECLDTDISSSPPGFMMIRGEVGRVEKIDDHTIKFSFPHPYSLFLVRLATNLGVWNMPNRPAHYLRQYHPRLGDPQKIAAAVKARGYANAKAMYGSLIDPVNPECPRLWPWISRTYSVGFPYTFVRNPYYFAVDPEGNQLPYIDRILIEAKSAEQIPSSLASGEVSFQSAGDGSFYTMLMAQRERFDYEVYHWYPGDRSSYVISPNLNRRIDPDQPDSKWKHQLLNDKRFRQALSYAIDRQTIIDAEFNGMAEPAQVAPGPASFFYEPSLYKSRVEYNPAKANALLDEAGLTGRDYEGFRTFPDGSRMTFYLSHNRPQSGPGQFVVDDWAKVGVRILLRYRSGGLFYNEKSALKHDFAVWSGSGEFFPILDPRHFIPFSMESIFAIGYARWVQAGGFYGRQMPDGGGGAIPIPTNSPLYESLKHFDAMFGVVDPVMQREHFRKVLKIAAENTWTINISTPQPHLVVVKNNMHNVPRKLVSAWPFLSPGNAGAETFYFKDVLDTPAAIESTQEELRTITPAPFSAAGRAAATAGSSPASLLVGKIIRYGFLSLAGLCVLMVALKHPFVGRRLLIMIPTLTIISMVCFVVIQLPPGNYLATKIMQMEEAGGTVNEQEIEDLQELFYLNDPMPVQYMRWLGLKWFITFNHKDTGLMQGNMGRSMVNNLSVNDLVADRILLTFLVSLGTILFTWALAIPIGIFSAVRQYSIMDYILTFFGFIGMCVPQFLLALLLMYFSLEVFDTPISGLFSAEYGGAPWSFGKFIDLLKHIWVPVVVLGVGGTASMIRVMRANLLDELNKPYVTTARAKGVRPLKLLMKYPVRIALNPFISGIGGIFPMLVSGGAIVAMVMSLPTIGPLMLDALMSEDMYMAGSMLMILSTLGVIGTLVSDLLLLWLDPRIRLQGGGK